MTEYYAYYNFETYEIFSISPNIQSDLSGVPYVLLSKEIAVPFMLGTEKFSDYTVVVDLLHPKKGTIRKNTNLVLKLMSDDFYQVPNITKLDSAQFVIIEKKKKVLFQLDINGQRLDESSIKYKKIMVTAENDPDKLLDTISIDLSELVKYQTLEYEKTYPGPSSYFCKKIFQSYGLQK